MAPTRREIPIPREAWYQTTFPLDLLNPAGCHQARLASTAASLFAYCYERFSLCGKVAPEEDLMGRDTAIPAGEVRWTGAKTGARGRHRRRRTGAGVERRRDARLGPPIHAAGRRAVPAGGL